MIAWLWSVLRGCAGAFGVCLHDDAMTEVDHAHRTIRLRCPACGKVSPGWTLDNYRERTSHNG